MKNAAALFILLLVSIWAFSQSKKISLETNFESDRSVSIHFQKNVPGTYYLNLTFTTLENASSSGFHSEIAGPGGVLMRLRPMNKDRSISVGYRYSYILGTLNPEYDPDFVYLLPFSEGKETKVWKMTYLNEKYFGADRPEGWVSYQFLAEPGDTVFATRKGLVVEIQDENDYNTDFEVDFQSKVNYVLVEHPDGTLARYDGLLRDEIFVVEGQEIYPHSVMGKLAQYDQRKQAQLRFSVYYLNNANITGEAQTMKNKIHYYGYIEPLFLTAGGTQKLDAGNIYKTVVDKDCITREFSRRELKKFEKNQLEISAGE